MRGFVRMFGLPVNWAIYEALEHSVKTGLPAADKTVPNGYWAYYAAPGGQPYFQRGNGGQGARPDRRGIMAAYDFSGFGLIGDIGGGRGHLLHVILDSTPTAKGVLFDLPHVVEEAAGMASDRLRLQSGDFFKDTLPACDAYLLMEVIHDWGDEESVAILKAIRRAAPPHAKLLLIETIVPDDPRSRLVEDAGHSHADPAWRATTHPAGIRSAVRQVGLSCPTRNRHRRGHRDP